MKTLKVVVAILLVFTFLAQAPSVFAEENTSGAKLKRGALNLLTCWLEVPRQIKAVTLENDPIAGITVGTAKGIGFTVARAVVGVFDLVTFYLRPYNEPIMEPDFAI